jgi:hypothetical protein
VLWIRIGFNAECRSGFGYSILGQCGSGSGTSSISESDVLIPKMVKILELKKNQIIFKIAIYLSMKDIQATGEAFTPNREHPAF